MKRIAGNSNKSKIGRNVIGLGIVSLFTDAASEMIYPLVPLFITLLGSSVVILGVIEGIAETTAAMLKLISGIISDRIGKRKLLVLIGYSISTIIRPFTGIVSAAWHIIFIRMLDRVGKGIRTAPRDALIASSIDDSIRGKAYGFHRAMDHAGAVVGPLLALITLSILIFGIRIHDALLILRYTFLLAIIPGLLAVVALILFVREKTDRGPVSEKIRFSIKQFDKNFIWYLGIVLLFTLGNSSDAFMLFRVQETINHSTWLYSQIMSIPFVSSAVGLFGSQEMQKKLVDIFFIPLVWAFFHIIKVIFSTPFGALSDRIGRKSVINIGWGIYAFVYVAFAVLDKIPDNMQVAVTFVLFAIYALYYAFSEGAEKAFVADVTASDQRGRAFGLFNFTVGLGALPASILFGVLYHAYGAAIAFGTGAGIACMAMVLLAVFVEEHSQI